MGWTPPIGFPLGRRPAEPEDDRALAGHESSKLEAVGQLAAGIAHEINTPIQFVGDSVRFLDQAFRDLLVLLVTYREALEDAPEDVREMIAAAEDAADLAYVEERVPLVFERVYGGVDRVSTLVRAMKSFAHSSPEGERGPADLNEALEATLTVAHNELKYVADVQVDLGDLPAVVCNRSELNQAFLNLVVNAAHAVQDVVGDSGERGLVRVTSRYVENSVVVTVSDTGCGIPPEIKNRIFEPFFTTKEVGRGTGQGLSLARAAVERNGGTLTCESEVGGGTTFTIRLLLERASELAA